MKNPKYIDLCFRLGKSCVALDERKKALEIFQEMVDTAQEIDFKLSFEQMILFSEMLIKPNSTHAPILDKYKKDLGPSQQDIYRLGWICNSLKEMKCRNFRPKQITECEAHVAIAYYRLFFITKIHSLKPPRLAKWVKAQTLLFDYICRFEPTWGGKLKA